MSRAKPSRRERSLSLQDRLEDYSQSAQTTLQSGPRSRKLAQRLTGASLAAGAAGMTLTVSSPALAEIIHRTVVGGAFGPSLGDGIYVTMEGTAGPEMYLGNPNTTALLVGNISTGFRVYNKAAPSSHVAALNASQYVGPVIGPQTVVPNASFGLFTSFTTQGE